MTTRVENVEEEIRKLNVAIEGLETAVGRLQVEIGGLETSQQSADADSSLAVKISEKTALMSDKTALLTATRNEITAKTTLLTALITPQQGNFASLISTVLSQSSRCNPCPIFLDISSSSIQVRQRRKVRCDIYS